VGEERVLGWGKEAKSTIVYKVNGKPVLTSDQSAIDSQTISCPPKSETVVYINCMHTKSNEKILSIFIFIAGHMYRT
jgi:hypothetical protein